MGAVCKRELAAYVLRHFAIFANFDLISCFSVVLGLARLTEVEVFYGKKSQDRYFLAKIRLKVWIFSSKLIEKRMVSPLFKFFTCLTLDCVDGFLLNRHIPIGHKRRYIHVTLYKRSSEKRCN